MATVLTDFPGLKGFNVGLVNYVNQINRLSDRFVQVLTIRCNRSSRTAEILYRWSGDCAVLSYILNGIEEHNPIFFYQVHPLAYRINREVKAKGRRQLD